MKRNIVSLTIGLVFIVMTFTGILMYFNPFQTPIAAVHTSFGFLFLFGIILHVWNNYPALKKYTIKKNSRIPINLPFILIFSALTIFGYTTYFGTLGFDTIYDWGNQYRSAQLGKDVQSHDYEYIALTRAMGDYTIELEGKKGSAFNNPMFAAWTEDPLGNYIKTIYASNTIGTSTYTYKKGVEGKHIIRRPSGAPVWAHRRNIIAEDGLMIPLNNAPDLDGYTGATPIKDFVIQTKTDIHKPASINVYFEVNQSYDWNDYYAEDRFPNDSIYTISGQSGQPSIIYGATIDLNFPENKRSFLLKPIGHGHHSGANGKLYQDLSNITTAFDIVERIMVTVYKK